MQIHHLNKIIFLSLLFLGYSQIANSQIDRNSLPFADQLFKNNHLLEAEKIYLNQRNQTKGNTYEIDHKLAFIAKEKNDWLMELYYLSSMQAQQTKLSASKRLAEIAQRKNLGGYELDLWARLRWIYFEFFPYILLFLLLPAIYVAYALIIKKVQNERIPPYQIISFGLYVFLLFSISNLPSVFSQGLTSSPKTYMRNFASSSAPVIYTMEKGTLINFIYVTNDWIPCYFDGKIGYIKSKDLLKIN